MIETNPAGATMLPAGPPATSELSRRIGLATATAVVVAEMIGVGVFLTTAGMAKSLGSPFWLSVVWLVMGTAAIGGAFCFGALAARRPEAGGPYVYLKDAYGPRVGFLYGWLSMLVTDPGITAVVAVGLAEYVDFLAPIGPWGRKGVAMAAIAVLAGVNVRGVALGAGLLRLLAALKLGLLGFLIFWGFASGKGDWSNFTPLVAQRPGSQPLVAALIGGFIAAFFSMGGWWDLGKLSGEVRDPARNVPRALVLGVSVVTLVYILITAVFLYLVPLERVDDQKAFAALAGEVLFGRLGGAVFSWIVIITVAGSLAAMLMAAPRVYFAMARDGLFFPSFAALHPRYGTPARATLIQAGLACALVAAGTFDQILAYFIVPTVSFLVLTVIALFWGAEGKASRTPGLITAASLFLVPTTALLVLFFMEGPRRAGIGLGVVLLGVPFSYLIHRP
jgi:APA family basic amino acid/polyamine antiporter